MTYNLGQLVTLTTSATSPTGVPTDVTIALTVTKPDGTTAALSSGPTRTDTGDYTATVLVDQVNTWFWRWDATGVIVDNDRGQFDVGDPKPLIYASLAKLKARLNITDGLNDDELGDALDAASRDVDEDCDRTFWLDPTATARVFDPHNRIVRTRTGERLLIDDIGSSVGIVVEIGDGTSWSPITDYCTGPDNALAKRTPITYLLRRWNSWLTCGAFLSQQIRVTARWGWPGVPSKIDQATLIRAQRLYRRKDSPEGVAGFNELGVVRIGRYDPDYDKLIGSFVRNGG